MYQLTDGGSVSNDADAQQATTATLVTVPVIHKPCGRSNITPGGTDNHKDTSYDKMNVIVKAAAVAVAKVHKDVNMEEVAKKNIIMKPYLRYH
jgi:hypothetical protein